MYNFILSRLRKPSKGFDPISKSYAKKYFEETYGSKRRLDATLISLLKQYKTLTDAEIVDLGGGPGHYSLILAKEGAKVHYHDISHNFIKLAVEKAENEGYSFTYTIDYIDHVKGPYDVIFNRGAFNYCFDDKKFVQILYNELKSEGIYFGILVNENQSFRKEKTPWLSKQTLFKIQFWLNDKLNIKIGHPFTSKKKIEKIFRASAFEILKLEDYGIQTIVIARKR
jgi:2-polyprenyl-3-methyl-5-hydroxy-6-metoxy-1,4-benzoquinol methylase